MEACFWEALQVDPRARSRRTPTWPRRWPARLRGGARAARRARPRAARRRAATSRPSTRSRRRSTARSPTSCASPPGTSTTLRDELGRALHHLNAASRRRHPHRLGRPARLDQRERDRRRLPRRLLERGRRNPDARLLSIGGICEDAITGVLSGLAAYGHAIGVGSSYGAFIAPLGHIAARLHAIGAQARQAVTGEPYKPIILVCAHAGLKTGEDGPTHADPQALQLLQENFPRARRSR